MAASISQAIVAEPTVMPSHPNEEDFTLVFADEFEGDAMDWSLWEVEDAIKRSASGQRTYRGKENVEVADGLMKLYVKKESLKGSEWTAAFVFLKKNYGPNTYYESRFINTEASGINNAFWTASKTSEFTRFENRYEIDGPENKLQTDGTIKSHLAWHDWKSYRAGDKQHVAQGIHVSSPRNEFETWGIWVGEHEFAIYRNGEMIWDGTDHYKYHDQWCSGMGKLDRWTIDEERRAYGKFGQDDWCYFGGMNGDAHNICLSTIPWETETSPLTEAADGAYMGVDYVRVFKRKIDLEDQPAQSISQPSPRSPIALPEPIELSQDTDQYIGIDGVWSANGDVSVVLRSGEKEVGRAVVTLGRTARIEINDRVASTVTSYPAWDRKILSPKTGRDHRYVVRLTGNSGGAPVLSLIGYPANKAPKAPPFQYRNIDDEGNTSLTNGWDLSLKLDHGLAVDNVVLEYDPAQFDPTELKIGRGFLSVQ